MNYKSEVAARAPELDRISAKIAELASRQKPLEECTPEEARLLRESRGNPFAPPDADLRSIEDIYIPASSGQLLARIYRPHTDMEDFQPALVYFHGGGFALGSVAGHDTVTRQLANLSSCVVISVEYRLAPEAKAFGIIDDGYEAFCWVREHATALGLDAKRIAMGGDSAGGNLAISASLRCVQDEYPLPAHLMLLYPITDWRFTSASLDEFATGYFLTKAGMVWFREQFLEDESQASNPLLSPALSPHLNKLPSTFIITAGFDPLRDEGKAFADQLLALGVPVEHLCYQDVIHAFVSFAGGIEQGMDALREAGDRLNKALSIF